VELYACFALPAAPCAYKMRDPCIANGEHG
jgi:hypothetical protein